MKQLYLHNVSTLKLDESKCVGCGRCTQVCPHGVFQIRDKKAVILELDRCMECGACARNCPADALWVKAGTGCAIASPGHDRPIPGQGGTGW